MNPDEMPTKYRFWYEMRDRFGGWSHAWYIMTAYGTVELRITEYKAESKISTTAGLEFHYRKSNHEDRAPDHDKCHALGGQPCWHTGTTLYAEENYLPLWPCEPKMMFQMLMGEVKRLEEYK